jgi:hypothetical protein
LWVSPSAPNSVRTIFAALLAQAVWPFNQKELKMHKILFMAGLACCFSSAGAQQSNYNFARHSFFAQNRDAGRGPTTSAAGNHPEEVKDKYHIVQVDSITVQADVQFPAEYLTKLQDEIGKELVKQKEFQEVIAPGQSPANPGAPMLRLGAEITGYTPGNKAERYIIGFGAGSTQVDAKISFLDGDTGRTAMTEDLRAVLAAGLFGGAAEDVVKDFARQIAVMTKLMLVKRLPDPNDVARMAETSKSSDSTGAEAAERRTITITGKADSWNPAQQQLDETSAAGFRVMGLMLKVKSDVEVLLQKMPAPPQVYTYKLLHTNRGVSSLEKDMNSASADGFRATKNTLALWNFAVSVIMEKPQIPTQTRYQYFINQSARISSAQKNTEKYEAAGYSLIGDVEHYGANLLLFEKPTEEKR